MSLNIGIILKNKYRILKKLGSGVFGGVYLAETVESPNHKMIIKEFLNPKDKTERSIIEIESSSLEQTGIPRLLTSFSTRDRYYQVFEFTPEATTLRELIDKSTPFSEGKAISFGIQLSDILKEFHSHGIVHRDIKPSNVLITSDQQLKVIDFGIATSIVKKQAKPVGTVGYAAPEQYHGVIDLRSDVYSFGVVLYEMLTGRRSKSRFSFIPIQKINPKVSSKLANLIHKCLELDRIKRPSMSEIYNTLLSIRRERGK